MKYSSFIPSIPSRFSAGSYELNYQDPSLKFAGQKSKQIDSFLEYRLPDGNLTLEPLIPTSITAIITTYNQTKHLLDRSLASILKQTSKFNEVIIYDGGSTFSETTSWLDSLKMSKEFKVFRDKNEGVIAARNKASILASGDFLLFLDPDDLLKEDFLKYCRDAISKYPSVDIVYTDVEVWNRNGEKEFWYTGPATFDQLLLHNRLPITSIVRRSFFTSVGGFRSALEKGPEDWDLWIRLVLHGARALHIPFSLFINTAEVMNSRTNLNSAHKEVEALRVQKDALHMLMLKYKFAITPIFKSSKS